MRQIAAKPSQRNIFAAFKGKPLWPLIFYFWNAVYKFILMNPHVRDITRCASARLGKVMGSILGIAKDVKSSTYCFFFRCTVFDSTIRGIKLLQTGATHCHTKLELSDKGRAIELKYWNTPQIHITNHISILPQSLGITVLNGTMHRWDKVMLLQLLPPPPTHLCTEQSTYLFQVDSNL